MIRRASPRLIDNNWFLFNLNNSRGGGGGDVVFYNGWWIFCWGPQKPSWEIKLKCVCAVETKCYGICYSKVLFLGPLFNLSMFSQISPQTKWWRSIWPDGTVAAGERVKLRVVNKHAFSVWLFLIEITHVSGINFRAAFYSVWWLESGCVFSPFIMHNITQFD